MAVDATRGLYWTRLDNWLHRRRVRRSVAAYYARVMDERPRWLGLTLAEMVIAALMAAGVVYALVGSVVQVIG